MKPAAIMERCSPGIIRIPVPAIIRIDPVPAIAIRAPGRVVNDHGRSPAAAVTFHIHPRTVRRKRIIKIIDGDIRRWRGSIFRRCIRGRVVNDWRRSIHHRRRGGGGNRSWWRGRRRYRRCIKRLVAIHHRVDDIARCAQIFQIENFISIQIKSALGILDEGLDRAGIDAGLKHFDDVGKGASGSNIWSSCGVAGGGGGCWRCGVGLRWRCR